MKNLRIRKGLSLMVKSVLILLFSLLIITGCRKDDEPEQTVVYQEESPFQDFLSAIGYNTQSTKIDDDYSWSLGLNFTPLVKGKINGVKVKLPAANPQLKITIWNALTGTIIRTETVNVAAANTQYTFTFSPLELQKDQPYIISFLSDDFFIYQKTTGQNGTFPVKVGNINIEKTSYALSSNLYTPTFPDKSEGSAAYGDLDMIFQQIP